MDYQKIIDDLSEERVCQILDKLKIPWVDKGSFLLCKTACHNVNLDEASSKLYYYKDTHMFMCYTECGAMSIFKFLEHYYTARDIAYNWHEDVLRLVADNVYDNDLIDFGQEKPHQKISERYQHQELKKLPSYPKGILDIFMKNYPIEWINDGISRRTMDKYDIKYSVSQNKIIIPHYDIENNLIGIRGRALNDWEIENVGKYMPVQIEKKWYSHPLSLNLYGLNMTKENIKKYGICYVGEAEKFVLQQESFKIPNCSCAVCGSQFNKFQLKLIMKHCHPQEIVICFDKEEKEGSDEYFNKLYRLCEKYKNYCKMSFIYDIKNLLQLKQSPTDCGETTFRKLLESRVIVK